jgi:hypothetical protein
MAPIITDCFPRLFESALRGRVSASWLGQAHVPKPLIPNRLKEGVSDGRFHTALI